MIKDGSGFEIRPSREEGYVEVAVMLDGREIGCKLMRQDVGDDEAQEVMWNIFADIVLKEIEEN